MARTYELKKHRPDKATAIAMPKAGDTGTTPKTITLDEEEQKAIKAYTAAQRAIARTKGTIVELLERHGKIAYGDVTFAPRVAMNYDYPEELAAEIEAIDSKKKAARDSGEAVEKPGAVSISFADKKAKGKGASRA